MPHLPVDICMFVHNDVASDGRVLREAGSLSAHGWNVTVVGIALTRSSLPQVETVFGFTIIRVKPSFFRRHLSGTFGKLINLLIALPAAAYQLRKTQARVYHANDFVGLMMIALAGIWRRPVVYDSHELFFDRFPTGLFNYPLKYVIWALRPLEKILARRAAAVITVGEGVAERLSQTLNIPTPVVVRNTVDLRHLQEAISISRKRGQQIAAHSGVVSGGRHLPELVAALRYLPEHMTIALIGDGRLRSALVEQAQNSGVADRLITVYPVNPYNIPTTLAGADAAVMLITSERLNYHLSLPNKFFEAVAAGLPIVTSPIPEVVRYVEQYDMGIICDPTDPKAIAEAIQTVLQPDNYMRFKANAMRARADLNWETEEQALINVYKPILDS